jgi:hypothetical protein
MSSSSRTYAPLSSFALLALLFVIGGSKSI